VPQPGRVLVRQFRETAEAEAAIMSSNRRTRLNSLVDEIRRRRAREYPPIDIVRAAGIALIAPDAADPGSVLGTRGCPARELMAGSPRSHSCSSPICVDSRQAEAVTSVSADPPAGAGEIPALVPARALETALDRPLRFVPRSEPEAIDRCIQCQVRLVNHVHQGRRLSCQDAVSRFGVA
jgi:hypothetical protein